MLLTYVMSSINSVFSEFVLDSMKFCIFKKKRSYISYISKEKSLKFYELEGIFAINYRLQPKYQLRASLITNLY